MGLSNWISPPFPPMNMFFGGNCYWGENGKNSEENCKQQNCQKHLIKNLKKIMLLLMSKTLKIILTIPT